MADPRPRFPIRMRLWRSPAIGLLALACVVSAVIIPTEVWPGGQFSVFYGPNLVAELVGLLLTVVVIERILRWQRERELAPLKIVATRIRCASRALPPLTCPF